MSLLLPSHGSSQSRRVACSFPLHSISLQLSALCGHALRLTIYIQYGSCGSFFEEPVWISFPTCLEVWASRDVLCSGVTFSSTIVETAFFRFKVTTCGPWFSLGGT
eukprot:TRINITY_DN42589_c0_g1_i6.p1 TRINITY_DN42589_c0_g1~~TRINITY_DN42589_c0_g1_i6.p1  ORF type:complete len:106 (+),score=1.62 TRINITY_DN42589_c0_g1_i6:287-604(+)